MENTAKMIEMINFMIKGAVNHYDGNGHQWDETHKINMAEIRGAVLMLGMVTGKSYLITEEGLVEADKTSARR